MPNLHKVRRHTELCTLYVKKTHYDMLVTWIACKFYQTIRISVAKTRALFNREEIRVVELQLTQNSFLVFYFHSKKKELRKVLKDRKSEFMPCKLTSVSELSYLWTSHCYVISSDPSRFSGNRSNFSFIRWLGNNLFFVIVYLQDAQQVRWEMTFITGKPL